MTNGQRDLLRWIVGQGREGSVIRADVVDYYDLCGIATTRGNVTRMLNRLVADGYVANGRVTHEALRAIQ